MILVLKNVRNMVLRRHVVHLNSLRDNCLIKKIAKKKTAEKNTYDKFDYDDALFSELRVLRNKLAMESSVPAYIVFADAALRDMCRKMPVTREEFLNVSGVGEAKADKYSEAFTSLIRNFKK